MSLIISRALLFTGAAVLTLAIGVGSALADRDDDRDEHNGRNSSSTMVEMNKTYSAECSSCHVLYAPYLLPARSWDKLLKGSKNHFGDDLSLSDAQVAELNKYLSANSADNSNNYLAKKIMRGLGNETPERIADVPYIKREHRKIDATVYKRKSIGSFSNCGACHPGADKWNFDEDAVSVPRQ